MQKRTKYHNLHSTVIVTFTSFEEFGWLEALHLLIPVCLWFICSNFSVDVITVSTKLFVIVTFSPFSIVCPVGPNQNIVALNGDSASLVAVQVSIISSPSTALTLDEDILTDGGPKIMEIKLY